MKGDCLACSRVEKCQYTNVEKILEGYTCDLFTAVSEAVYKARAEMQLTYGDKAVAEALMESNMEDKTR